VLLVQVASRDAAHIYARVPVDPDAAPNAIAWFARYELSALPARDHTAEIITRLLMALAQPQSGKAKSRVPSTSIIAPSVLAAPGMRLQQQQQQQQQLKQQHHHGPVTNQHLSLHTASGYEEAARPWFDVLFRAYAYLGYRERGMVNITFPHLSGECAPAASPSSAAGGVAHVAAAAAAAGAVAVHRASTTSVTTEGSTGRDNDDDDGDDDDGADPASGSTGDRADQHDGGGAGGDHDDALASAAADGEDELEDDGVFVEAYPRPAASSAVTAAAAAIHGATQGMHRHFS